MIRTHWLFKLFSAVVVTLSMGLVNSHFALANQHAAESGEQGGFDNPGNVLISDQYNNRAIEVDRATKRIVWRFGSNRPNLCNPGPHTIIGLNDAERLAGGLTLLAGTGVPAGASPLFPNFSCVDNRVIVVDESGKIVWQYGQAGVTGAGPNQLNVPVFAIQLPNRNIMIVDQSNERVIEVDRFSKKIVWQYGTTGVVGNGPNQLNNPNSAELLSNGNVLIADENNNRAIEVRPDHKAHFGGAIVHVFTAAGTTSLVAFASRLPNGHTLLTDSMNSRIVEVDASDNVKWQYFTNTQAGSNTSPLPTNAVRLLNGDTAIADQYNHRALIIRRNKQIRFQYGMLNMPGNDSNQLDGPYTAFVIGDYTGQTRPPEDF